ncbi:hypothetical protein FB451DRAFT_1175120 [Mycena latifolia]|nr:hypothetical protein FB451DRAFT_1175120 [Mycena latifolia]
MSIASYSSSDVTSSWNGIDFLSFLANSGAIPQRSPSLTSILVSVILWFNSSTAPSRSTGAISLPYSTPLIQPSIWYQRWFFIREIIVQDYMFPGRLLHRRRIHLFITRVLTFSSCYFCLLVWPVDGSPESSPQFNGKTASSLKRFIRHCKMVIEGAGITTGKGKKDTMTDYLANNDIRDQMENLPAFQSGTLDEWIAEMEELYPEIQDFGVGSLERLKICEEYKGLEQSQQGLVKRYGVAFSNESNKLLKAPALVANRELVEYYLGAFEPHYEGDIRNMMNYSILMKDTIVGVTPPARWGYYHWHYWVVRREDSVPLSTVMTIAEAISKRWISASSNTKNLPTKKAFVAEAVTLEESFILKFKQEVSERLENFANEMALFKDSSILQEKHLQESINGLSQSLKMTLAQMTRLQPPHLDMNVNNDNSNCGSNEGGSNDKAYKSRKERVDNYYVSQGIPRPPMQALVPSYTQQLYQAMVQSYSQLPYPQYTQGNGTSDNVGDVYDSRDDELRSLRVQRNLQQAQLAVPTQQTITQLSNQNFVPIPPAPSILPQGVDMAQLVQLFDLVKSAGQNNRNTQEQFVHTRTGASSNAPAKPNFSVPRDRLLK